MWISNPGDTFRESEPASAVIVVANAERRVLWGRFYGDGAMNTPDSGSSSTLRELLKQLTDELSTLFRQEVALASAEFSRSITTLVKGATSMAAGGAVVFAGFLVLLAAAVLGLAEWLEPWLAALVVGVAVVALGALVLLAGKQKLDPAKLKPEHVPESLRRDKEVLARRGL
jgi:hypothetical protein